MGKPITLNVGASGAVFVEYATFSSAFGAGTGTRSQLLFGASRDVGARLQLDVEGTISPTAFRLRSRSIGVGASDYL